MGRARALAAATLFCVGSLAAIAFGADVAVPPLDSPVMDRAELLDAPTERALVSRLLAYERQSGHQVVVHTTPSLEGLDIESYSIDVAEQWKVGHKGLDNGVIFTVAPNERKLRIEVGYGLEGVLPDIIAGQIVRDIVVPQLRGGDPSGAILSGVDAIVAAASGEVVEVPEAARPPRRALTRARAARLGRARVVVPDVRQSRLLLPAVHGRTGPRGRWLWPRRRGFRRRRRRLWGRRRLGELVMRVEALFSGAGREAIEAAVRAAEANTSGEIVPMVVDRSDAYPGVRAASGALLAFAAGMGVLESGIDPWLWLFPTQFVVFGAGYALFGWRPLLRWLIPAGVAAERVDRAAQLAFLAEGVVETRDRTGILIYVSLLEHRVEVLADRGIHSQVEAGTWDGIVERVLTGIRSARAEEGLIDAIAHCGELLAERFPPRHDDTDELGNTLR